MIRQLVTYLINNNLMLSCYESFTGGYFSHLVTNIPGASKCFKGGIVVYSSEAKIDVGEVDSTIIKKYGVISSQTAKKMIDACYKKFVTDVVVSFTGNAGPSALEKKDVGKIFIGIKVFNNIKILDLQMPSHLSRIAIKKTAVNIAVQEIFVLLNKKIKENFIF